ncbi:MAG: segregation/condensation protein A, partial [Deltaproteobacteria bacterium]|nr:segregation/condensation protein A [Deltaproteobacteria bacterium]
MDINIENLSLKIDIYEGPLDLLLHLIKKNKVDIYDIPISMITTQYLDYLKLLEELKLEIFTDFLLMAATLAQIKSKMLLPMDEEAKDDPAYVDPRIELLAPLLEYAAYKEATDKLASRPFLNRDVFKRGGEDGLATLGLGPEEEMPKLGQPVAKISSFELAKTWNGLIRKRADEGLPLSFFMETMTIGQKISKIRAFLIETKTAHFRQILSPRNDKFDFALCFLAILELAKTGFLRLWQDPAEDT